MQPSRLKLQHNYTGPADVYNIGVDVMNDVTAPASTSFPMDVREPITGTHFNCSDICKLSYIHVITYQISIKH